MKRYPQEVHDFIHEHYRGITSQALADLVNIRFGAGYTTAGRMRSYKKNHGLVSGVKPGAQEGYYSKTFPREVCEYIYANYEGVGPTEMTKRLNARFGAEYKSSQVKGFYGNHHLNSGVTGRFEKGQAPYNKGKKGWNPSGCEKGWFKKGNIPHTHKPIGMESLRSDGYWWVKVAEPNKWREKHVLIWEAAHGKKPPGHIITFLDGNRSNFAPENLALITRAEHAVMSRFNLRSEDLDFTGTGLLLAKVKIAKTKAARKHKGKGRRGSENDKLPDNGQETPGMIRRRPSGDGEVQADE